MQMSILSIWVKNRKKIGTYERLKSYESNLHFREMGSTEGTTTWEFDTITLSLVINIVIFVLGTVGNGLVIYVAGFRMKRTVNTVWFLNLAVADFFFTAFLIFTIVSHDNQWSFGRVMCKLCTFFAVLNLFASVFILLAISVDRCLVTTMVVWAQNKRTVPIAKLVCLVIWIIAIICSTPYATFCDIKVKHNATYCEYILTREIYTILIFFRFIVGFLVPFVGISISYVVLYCHVRRLQTTKKGKPQRMIIAVILAFFLCWLPFHVVELYSLFSINRKFVSFTVGPLTLNLAFLNSCLNPILYVFMCEDFRTKLKQSVCFVLENALAEEHQNFPSFRSVPAHFTRTTHQSVALTDNKDMCPEVKGEVQLETNDTHPNSV